VNSGIQQYISDPIANWPNDDLLIREDVRFQVQEHFPTLYPIVDWPDLRQVFLRHDEIANNKKVEVSRRGRLIVVFGVLGLTLAATTGLFTTTTSLSAWFGAAAALFSLASLVLGALFRLRNPQRREWLQSRYITERIRHFYFQFMLTHASEIVGLLGADSSTKTLMDKKKKALAAFESHHIGQQETPEKYRQILDDVAESDHWLEEAGKKPAQWSINNDISDEQQARLFLTFMRRQRIGVQLAYMEKKQTDSLFSAKFLNKLIKLGVDALTVLIMITALLVGLHNALSLDSLNQLPTALLHWIERAQFSLTFFPNTHTLIFFGAVAAALVAGLRAFSQGKRLREESERYNWYEAAILEIGHDFDTSADDSQRFSALMHLETAAYRETRAFLASQQRARFLVD